MNSIEINIVSMEWWHWIAYLICAVLGGFASSFINNRGIWIKWRWENEQKERFILGPITDITAGMAAAMGILWTMTPQTIFQLFGMGAVAGYGGSSILQALVNRLIADVSQSEKEKVTKEKEEITKEKEESMNWRKTVEDMERQLDKDKALLVAMEEIRKAK